MKSCPDILWFCSFVILSALNAKVVHTEELRDVLTWDESKQINLVSVHAVSINCQGSIKNARGKVDSLISELTEVIQTCEKPTTIPPKLWKGVTEASRILKTTALDVRQHLKELGEHFMKLCSGSTNEELKRIVNSEADEQIELVVNVEKYLSNAYNPELSLQFELKTSLNNYENDKDTVISEIQNFHTKINDELNIMEQFTLQVLNELYKGLTISKEMTAQNDSSYIEKWSTDYCEKTIQNCNQLAKALKGTQTEKKSQKLDNSSQRESSVASSESSEETDDNDDDMDEYNCNRIFKKINHKMMKQLLAGVTEIKDMKTAKEIDERMHQILLDYSAVFEDLNIKTRSVIINITHQFIKLFRVILSIMEKTNPKLKSEMESIYNDRDTAYVNENFENVKLYLVENYLSDDKVQELYQKIAEVMKTSKTDKEIKKNVIKQLGKVTSDLAKDVRQMKETTVYILQKIDKGVRAVNNLKDKGNASGLMYFFSFYNGQSDLKELQEVMSLINLLEVDDSVDRACTSDQTDERDILNYHVLMQNIMNELQTENEKIKNELKKVQPNEIDIFVQSKLAEYTTIIRKYINETKMKLISIATKLVVIYQEIVLTREISNTHDLEFTFNAEISEDDSFNIIVNQYLLDSSDIENVIQQINQNVIEHTDAGQNIKKTVETRMDKCYTEITNDMNRIDDFVLTVMKKLLTAMDEFIQIKNAITSQDSYHIEAQKLDLFTDIFKLMNLLHIGKSEILNDLSVHFQKARNDIDELKYIADEQITELTNDDEIKTRLSTFFEKYNEIVEIVETSIQKSVLYYSEEFNQLWITLVQKSIIQEDEMNQTTSLAIDVKYITEDVVTRTVKAFCDDVQNTNLNKETALQKITELTETIKSEITNLETNSNEIVKYIHDGLQQMKQLISSEQYMTEEMYSEILQTKTMINTLRSETEILNLQDLSVEEIITTGRKNIESEKERVLESIIPGTEENELSNILTQMKDNLNINFTNVRKQCSNKITEIINDFMQEYHQFEETYKDKIITMELRDMEKELMEGPERDEDLQQALENLNQEVFSEENYVLNKFEIQFKDISLDKAKNYIINFEETLKEALKQINTMMSYCKQSYKHGTEALQQIQYTMSEDVNSSIDKESIRKIVLSIMLTNTLSKTTFTNDESPYITLDNSSEDHEMEANKKIEEAIKQLEEKKQQTIENITSFNSENDKHKLVIATVEEYNNIYTNARQLVRQNMIDDSERFFTSFHEVMNNIATKSSDVQTALRDVANCRGIEDVEDDETVSKVVSYISSNASTDTTFINGLYKDIENGREPDCEIDYAADVSTLLTDVSKYMLSMKDIMSQTKETIQKGAEILTNIEKELATNSEYTINEEQKRELAKCATIAKTISTKLTVEESSSSSWFSSLFDSAPSDLKTNSRSLPDDTDVTTWIGDATVKVDEIKEKTIESINAAKDESEKQQIVAATVEEYEHTYTEVREQVAKKVTEYTEIFFTSYQQVINNYGEKSPDIQTALRDVANCRGVEDIENDENVSNVVSFISSSAFTDTTFVNSLYSDIENGRQPDCEIDYAGDVSTLSTDVSKYMISMKDTMSQTKETIQKGAEILTNIEKELATNSEYTINEEQKRELAKCANIAKTISTKLIVEESSSSSWFSSLFDSAPSDLETNSRSLPDDTDVTTWIGDATVKVDEIKEKTIESINAAKDESEKQQIVTATVEEYEHTYTEVREQVAKKVTEYTEIFFASYQQVINNYGEKSPDIQTALRDVANCRGVEDVENDENVSNVVSFISSSASTDTTFVNSLYRDIENGRQPDCEIDYAGDVSTLSTDVSKYMISMKDTMSQTKETIQKGAEILTNIEKELATNSEYTINEEQTRELAKCATIAKTISTKLTVEESSSSSWFSSLFDSAPSDLETNSRSLPDDTDVTTCIGDATVKVDEIKEKTIESINAAKDESEKQQIVTATVEEYEHTYTEVREQVAKKVTEYTEIFFASYQQVINNYDEKSPDIQTALRDVANCRGVEDVENDENVSNVVSFISSSASTDTTFVNSLYRDIENGRQPDCEIDYAGDVSTLSTDVSKYMISMKDTMSQTKETIQKGAEILTNIEKELATNSEYTINEEQKRELAKCATIAKTISTKLTVEESSSSSWFSSLFDSAPSDFETNSRSLPDDTDVTTCIGDATVKVDEIKEKTIESINAAKDESEKQQIVTATVEEYEHTYTEVREQVAKKVTEYTEIFFASYQQVINNYGEKSPDIQTALRDVANCRGVEDIENDENVSNVVSFISSSAFTDTTFVNSLYSDIENGRQPDCEIDYAGDVSTLSTDVSKYMISMKDTMSQTKETIQKGAEILTNIEKELATNSEYTINEEQTRELAKCATIAKTISTKLTVEESSSSSWFSSLFDSAPSDLETNSRSLPDDTDVTTCIGDATVKVDEIKEKTIESINAAKDESEKQQIVTATVEEYEHTYTEVREQVAKKVTEYTEIFFASYQQVINNYGEKSPDIQTALRDVANCRGVEDVENDENVSNVVSFISSSASTDTTFVNSLYRDIENGRQPDCEIDYAGDVSTLSTDVSKYMISMKDTMSQTKETIQKGAEILMNIEKELATNSEYTINEEQKRELAKCATIAKTISTKLTVEESSSSSWFSSLFDSAPSDLETNSRSLPDDTDVTTWIGDATVKVDEIKEKTIESINAAKDESEKQQIVTATVEEYEHTYTEVREQVAKKVTEYTEIFFASYQQVINNYGEKSPDIQTALRDVANCRGVEDVENDENVSNVVSFISSSASTDTTFVNSLYRDIENGRQPDCEIDYAGDVSTLSTDVSKYMISMKDTMSQTKETIQKGAEILTNIEKELATNSEYTINEEQTRELAKCATIAKTISTKLTVEESSSSSWFSSLFDSAPSDLETNSRSLPDDTDVTTCIGDATVKVDEIKEKTIESINAAKDESEKQQIVTATVEEYEHTYTEVREQVAKKVTEYTEIFFASYQQVINNYDEKSPDIQTALRDVANCRGVEDVENDENVSNVVSFISSSASTDTTFVNSLYRDIENGRQPDCEIDYAGDVSTLSTDVSKYMISMKDTMSQTKETIQKGAEILTNIEKELATNSEYTINEEQKRELAKCATIAKTISTKLTVEESSSSSWFSSLFDSAPSDFETNSRSLPDDTDVTTCIGDATVKVDEIKEKTIESINAAKDESEKQQIVTATVEEYEHTYTEVREQVAKKVTEYTEIFFASYQQVINNYGEKSPDIQTALRDVANCRGVEDVENDENVSNVVSFISSSASTDTTFVNSLYRDIENGRQPDCEIDYAGDVSTLSTDVSKYMISMKDTMSQTKETIQKGAEILTNIEKELATNSEYTINEEQTRELAKCATIAKTISTKLTVEESSSSSWFSSLFDSAPSDLETNSRSLPDDTDVTTCIGDATVKVDEIKEKTIESINAAKDESEKQQIVTATVEEYEHTYTEVREQVAKKVTEYTEIFFASYQQVINNYGEKSPDIQTALRDVANCRGVEDVENDENVSNVVSFISSSASTDTTFVNSLYRDIENGRQPDCEIDYAGDVSTLSTDVSKYMISMKDTMSQTKETIQKGAEILMNIEKELATNSEYTINEEQKRELAKCATIAKTISTKLTVEESSSSSWFSSLFDSAPSDFETNSRSLPDDTDVTTCIGDATVKVDEIKEKTIESINAAKDESEKQQIVTATVEEYEHTYTEVREQVAKKVTEYTEIFFASYQQVINNYGEKSPDIQTALRDVANCRGVEDVENDENVSNVVSFISSSASTDTTFVNSLYRDIENGRQPDCEIDYAGDVSTLSTDVSKYMISMKDTMSQTKETIQKGAEILTNIEKELATNSEYTINEEQTRELAKCATIAKTISTKLTVEESSSSSWFSSLFDSAPSDLETNSRSLPDDTDVTTCIGDATVKVDEIKEKTIESINAAKDESEKQQIVTATVEEYEHTYTEVREQVAKKVTEYTEIFFASYQQVINNYGEKSPDIQTALRDVANCRGVEDVENDENVSNVVSFISSSASTDTTFVNSLYRDIENGRQPDCEIDYAGDVSTLSTDVSKYMISMKDTMSQTKETIQKGAEILMNIEKELATNSEYTINEEQKRELAKCATIAKTISTKLTVEESSSSSWFSSLFDSAPSDFETNSRSLPDDTDVTTCIGDATVKVDEIKEKTIESINAAKDESEKQQIVTATVEEYEHTYTEVREQVAKKVTEYTEIFFASYQQVINNYGEKSPDIQTALRDVANCRGVEDVENDENVSNVVSFISSSASTDTTFVNSLYRDIENGRQPDCEIDYAGDVSTLSTDVSKYMISMKDTMSQTKETIQKGAEILTNIEKELATNSEYTINEEQTRELAKCATIAKTISTKLTVEESSSSSWFSSLFDSAPSDLETNSRSLPDDTDVTTCIGDATVKVDEIKEKTIESINAAKDESEKQQIVTATVEEYEHTYTEVREQVAKKVTEYTEIFFASYQQVINNYGEKSPDIQTALRDVANCRGVEDVENDENVSNVVSFISSSASTDTTFVNSLYRDIENGRQPDCEIDYAGDVSTLSTDVSKYMISMKDTMSQTKETIQKGAEILMNIEKELATNSEYTINEEQKRELAKCATIAKTISTKLTVEESSSSSWFSSLFDSAPSDFETNSRSLPDDTDVTTCIGDATVKVDEIKEKTIESINAAKDESEKQQIVTATVEEYEHTYTEVREQVAKKVTEYTEIFFASYQQVINNYGEKSPDIQTALRDVANCRGVEDVENDENVSNVVSFISSSASTDTTFVNSLYRDIENGRQPDCEIDYAGDVSTLSTDVSKYMISMKDTMSQTKETIQKGAEILTNIEKELATNSEYTINEEQTRELAKCATIAKTISTKLTVEESSSSSWFSSLFDSAPSDLETNSRSLPDDTDVTTCIGDATVKVDEIKEKTIESINAAKDESEKQQIVTATVEEYEHTYTEVREQVAKKVTEYTEIFFASYQQVINNYGEKSPDIQTALRDVANCRGVEDVENDENVSNVVSFISSSASTDTTFVNSLYRDIENGRQPDCEIDYAGDVSTLSTDVSKYMISMKDTMSQTKETIQKGAEILMNIEKELATNSEYTINEEQKRELAKCATIAKTISTKLTVEESSSSSWFSSLFDSAPSDFETNSRSLPDDTDVTTCIGDATVKVDEIKEKTIESINAAKDESEKQQIVTATVEEYEHTYTEVREQVAKKVTEYTEIFFASYQQVINNYGEKSPDIQTALRDVANCRGVEDVENDENVSNVVSFISSSASTDTTFVNSLYRDIENGRQPDCEIDYAGDVSTLSTDVSKYMISMKDTMSQTKETIQKGAEILTNIEKKLATNSEYTINEEQTRELAKCATIAKTISTKLTVEESSSSSWFSSLFDSAPSDLETNSRSLPDDTDVTTCIGDATVKVDEIKEKTIESINAAKDESEKQQIVTATVEEYEHTYTEVREQVAKKVTEYTEIFFASYQQVINNYGEKSPDIQTALRDVANCQGVEDVENDENVSNVVSFISSSASTDTTFVNSLYRDIENGRQPDCEIDYAGDVSTLSTDVSKYMISMKDTMSQTKETIQKGAEILTNIEKELATNSEYTINEEQTRELAKCATIAKTISTKLTVEESSSSSWFSSLFDSAPSDLETNSRSLPDDTDVTTCIGDATVKVDEIKEKTIESINAAKDESEKQQIVTATVEEYEHTYTEVREQVAKKVTEYTEIFFASYQQVINNYGEKSPDIQTALRDVANCQGVEDVENDENVSNVVSFISSSASTDATFVNSLYRDIENGRQPDCEIDYAGDVSTLSTDVSKYMISMKDTMSQTKETIQKGAEVLTNIEKELATNSEYTINEEQKRELAKCATIAKTISTKLTVEVSSSSSWFSSLFDSAPSDLETNSRSLPDDTDVTTWIGDATVKVDEIKEKTIESINAAKDESEKQQIVTATVEEYEHTYTEVREQVAKKVTEYTEIFFASYQQVINNYGEKSPDIQTALRDVANCRGVEDVENDENVSNVVSFISSSASTDTTFVNSLYRDIENGRQPDCEIDYAGDVSTLSTDVSKYMISMKDTMSQTKETIQKGAEILTNIEKELATNSEYTINEEQKRELAKCATIAKTISTKLTVEESSSSSWFSSLFDSAPSDFETNSRSLPDDTDVTTCIGDATVKVDEIKEKTIESINAAKDEFEKQQIVTATVEEYEHTYTEVREQVAKKVTEYTEIFFASYQQVINNYGEKSPDIQTALRDVANCRGVEDVENDENVSNVVSFISSSASTDTTFVNSLYRDIENGRQPDCEIDYAGDVSTLSTDVSKYMISMKDTMSQTKETIQKGAEILTNIEKELATNSEYTINEEQTRELAKCATIAKTISTKLTVEESSSSSWFSSLFDSAPSDLETNSRSLPDDTDVTTCIGDATVKVDEIKEKTIESINAAKDESEKQQIVTATVEEYEHTYTEVREQVAKKVTEYTEIFFASYQQVINNYGEKSPDIQTALRDVANCQGVEDVENDENVSNVVSFISSSASTDATFVNSLYRDIENGRQPDCEIDYAGDVSTLSTDVSKYMISMKDTMSQTKETIQKGAEILTNIEKELATNSEYTINEEQKRELAKCATIAKTISTKLTVEESSSSSWFSSLFDSAPSDLETNSRSLPDDTDVTTWIGDATVKVDEIKEKTIESINAAKDESEKQQIVTATVEEYEHTYTEVREQVAKKVTEYTEIFFASYQQVINNYGEKSPDIQTALRDVANCRGVEDVENDENVSNVVSFISSSASTDTTFVNSLYRDIENGRQPDCEIDYAGDVSTLSTDVSKYMISMKDTMSQTKETIQKGAEILTNIEKELATNSEYTINEEQKRELAKCATIAKTISFTFKMEETSAASWFSSLFDNVLKTKILLERRTDIQPASIRWPSSCRALSWYEHVYTINREDKKTVDVIVTLLQVGRSIILDIISLKRRQVDLYRENNGIKSLVTSGVTLVNEVLQQISNVIGDDIQKLANSFKASLRCKQDEIQTNSVDNSLDSDFLETVKLFILLQYGVDNFLLDSIQCEAADSVDVANQKFDELETTMMTVMDNVDCIVLTAVDTLLNGKASLNDLDGNDPSQKMNEYIENSRLLADVINSTEINWIADKINQ